MKLHSNIFGWEYVWEEFAEQRSGAVVKDYDTGSILSVELGLPQFESTATITPTSAGTCIVSNYHPSDDFVFRLFVEKLIHKVEKVFGLQDITTGDKEFDNRFVIQSNDADRVKRVFSDSALRQLILASHVDSITVVNGDREKQHSHLPDHHHLLICDWHHFIDKFDLLDAGLQVIQGALQQLQQCGALGHGAPKRAAQRPQPPQAVAQAVRLHSPLLGR